MGEIFLPRFLAALVLVAVTYNPTGHSFFHWVVGQNQAVPLSVKVLAGIVLLIGYVIYIRATLRSIGVFGIMLAGGLLAAMVWVMFDYGLIAMQDVGLLSWLAILVLAFVMAIGLSWSHVRRRLSGQVDVDDVGD